MHEYQGFTRAGRWGQKARATWAQWGSFLPLPPNRFLSCQIVPAQLPDVWAFVWAVQVVMQLGGGSSRGEGTPVSTGALLGAGHTLPTGRWVPPALGPVVGNTPAVLSVFRVLCPGGDQAGAEPWPEEVGDGATPCALAPRTGALAGQHETAKVGHPHPKRRLGPCQLGAGPCCPPLRGFYLPADAWGLPGTIGSAPCQVDHEGGGRVSGSLSQATPVNSCVQQPGRSRPPPHPARSPPSAGTISTQTPSTPRPSSRSAWSPRPCLHRMQS